MQTFVRFVTIALEQIVGVATRVRMYSEDIAKLTKC
jgi:hypothetical protein